MRIRTPAPLLAAMLAATVAVSVTAFVAVIAPTAPSILAAEDPAAAPVLPNWKKGDQTGTVSIDGHDEAFAALVPSGYSAKKPCAVVLLLHGNGGKAADFLQTCKTLAGKSPPLLISLERCDNQQKAEGYGPKYLTELKKQFAIDDTKVFAVGFSGGGFRLWDDVVCKAEEAAKFRGVILVGSAKQSFEPADKPTPAAPTVILVGDPKDSNFTDTAPAAEKALLAKAYEVIVLEHKNGHSMSAPDLKDVFTWIDAVIDGKKTTLATRRVEAEKEKAGKKK